MPVLVAVAGLVLVQRLVPPDRRAEHNDVAGFIYAVLGVAYAVLLGFVKQLCGHNYAGENTSGQGVHSRLR